MFTRLFFNAIDPDSKAVNVGANALPVPESVADRCYSPEFMKRFHGLSPGQEYCPCGAVVGDAYESRCGSCSRPYPLSCHHCGDWVHAEDVNGSGWYGPGSECSRCQGNAARAARSSVLKQIPYDIRAGAEGFVPGVSSRQHAVDVLDKWSRADCGRVPRVRPFVWIAGGHRTGKSVAVARTVSVAVKEGRLSSLVWCTYDQIINASKVRFLGEGGDLLSRCKSVGVLVIDEVFGDEVNARARKSPQRRDTPASVAAFVDVLRARAASRMPTIVVGLWGLQALRDVSGESAHDRIACVCEIADIGDTQVNGRL